MRIGSSIALIAIGAILAFAIAPGVIPFVDQVLIGYILMVVGVIGLIVSLIMASSERRRVVEHRGPDTAVEHRDRRNGGI
jgi:phosphate/sulfate permease